MGRTRRHRLAKRKKGNERSVVVDCESHTIELNKWLKQHGVSNRENGRALLKCAYTKETGHGIVCNSRISKGGTIVSIPDNLIIHSETVRKSRLGQAFDLYSSQLNHLFAYFYEFVSKKQGNLTSFLANPPPLNFNPSNAKRKPFSCTPHILLCLFLVSETQKGDSFWKPYLDSIPKSFDTPLSYSAEELRLLPPDVLYRSDKAIKNCLAAFHYAALCAHAIPELFPNISCLETDWVWAWCAVSTRCVYFNVCKDLGIRKSWADFSFSHISDEFRNELAYGSSHPFVNLLGKCSVDVKRNKIAFEDSSRHLGTEDDDIALAPFLDMLNHKDGVEIQAGFCQKTKCYRIKSTQNVLRGQEVFINYGPHDNDRLLIDYGFVLEKNDNNKVPLKRELIAVVERLCSAQMKNSGACVRDLDSKMEFLKRREFFKQIFTCEEEGPSWNLLCCLRILLSSCNSNSKQHDFDQLIGCTSTPDLAKFCVESFDGVNISLESSVLDCLIDMLKESYEIHEILRRKALLVSSYCEINSFHLFCIQSLLETRLRSLSRNIDVLEQCKMHLVLLGNG